MIKLVNVSKYYHNEGVVSLGLRKINLEFNIGEFVAITEKVALVKHAFKCHQRY